MKKLSIILILSVFGFSQETVTANEYVNLRANPHKNAKFIKTVPKGTLLEVIDIFGDYYEVRVVENEPPEKSSDHVGKNGYMWEKCVDVKMSKVINEGCTLRKTPKKIDNGTPADTADDPNFIAKVKKGAKLKVIRTVVTWLNVQWKDESGLNTGWVYKKYTDK